MVLRRARRERASSRPPMSQDVNRLKAKTAIFKAAGRSQNTTKIERMRSRIVGYRLLGVSQRRRPPKTGTNCAKNRTLEA